MDMNRLKAMIWLTVTAALTAGCRGDKVTATGYDQPVELRLASNIDIARQVSTRAHETAWEDDDVIGLFAVYYENQQPVDAIFNASNTPYRFDDGTNYETYIAGDTVYRLFSPVGGPAYLSPDERITFSIYAYYPWASSTTNGHTVPISIMPDQSSPGMLKSSDFMRGVAVNNNNRINMHDDTVRVLFSHKLTKLRFNLFAQGDMGPDTLEAADVRITIDGEPLQARYDIFSNRIMINPNIEDYETITASEVLPTPAGTPQPTHVQEAIVMPNSDDNPANTKHKVTVYVDLSNTPAGGHSTYDALYYTFDIESGTQFSPDGFRAGYQYDYNVTLDTKEIRIVDVELHNWVRDTIECSFFEY